MAFGDYCAVPGDSRHVFSVLGDSEDVLCRAWGLTGRTVTYLGTQKTYWAVPGVSEDVLPQRVSLIRKQ